jgi:hypothetical protein
MNCFNHRDKPAIGLCKSCGKALCADCFHELPNGLSCKGSCEDRVNMINRLIDKITQTLAARERLLRQYGLLMVLVGIGFIIFVIAYSSVFANVPQIPYFFVFIGGVFVVFGILILRRKEQYPKPDEQKSQS